MLAAVSETTHTHTHTHTHTQVCATAVLAAVSETSFQARIAASLGASVLAEDILVINTTALGGAGGLVDVEYCMVDAATVGLSNSYGYLPQIAASYLAFSIPLTRVQSVNPQFSTLNPEP